MITKLAQFTDIRIALVVGGLSLQVQAATLRTSPEVVVATPVRAPVAGPHLLTYMHDPMGSSACLSTYMHDPMGSSAFLLIYMQAHHGLHCDSCVALFYEMPLLLLRWIYLPARICLLASLKPGAR